MIRYARHRPTREKGIWEQAAIFAVGAGIIAGAIYFFAHEVSGVSRFGSDTRDGSARGQATGNASDPVSPCRKIEAGRYDCTQPEIIQKAKQVKKWYVKQETKRVILTAYNSVPGQTDSRPCEAADGADICDLELQGQHSISCPRSIPFGSTILIPSIGLFTCHDRKNRHYDKSFDVYMGGIDRINAANAFGVQTLEVTITY